MPVSPSSSAPGSLPGRTNGGDVTQVHAKRLADGVSAELPDWSREKRTRFWEPSRALIAALRSYERHAARGGFGAAFGKWLAVMRHRFWSIVTGAEIPLGTKIGGGLVMPHPNGIVIHAAAQIGPNCLIMQNVTIGTNMSRLAPRIGGHVDIYAGACVLGAICVGDHARVGALALVLEDVPAGATVVARRGEIRTSGQTDKKHD